MSTNWTGRRVNWHGRGDNLSWTPDFFETNYLRIDQMDLTKLWGFILVFCLNYVLCFSLSFGEFLGVFWLYFANSVYIPESMTMNQKQKDNEILVWLNLNPYFVPEYCQVRVRNAEHGWWWSDLGRDSWRWKSRRVPPKQIPARSLRPNSSRDLQKVSPLSYL